MEVQEDKMRNVEDARGSISAGRVAEDMSALGDKAKSNIAEAAESAKVHARRIAIQQKDAGADRLGDVPGAFHGAARGLQAGSPRERRCLPARVCQCCRAPKRCPAPPLPPLFAQL